MASLLWQPYAPVKSHLHFAGCVTLANRSLKMFSWGLICAGLNDESGLVWVSPLQELYNKPPFEIYMFHQRICHKNQLKHHNEYRLCIWYVCCFPPLSKGNNQTFISCRPALTVCSSKRVSTHIFIFSWCFCCHHQHAVSRWSNRVLIDVKQICHHWWHVIHNIDRIWRWTGNDKEKINYLQ